MSAVDTFIHLFLPHESNNHRAKVIHSSTITIIAIFLIVFQIGLNFVPKSFPQVLGYASSISPSEVIRLTNEQRKSQGLSPLSENSQLSSAALAKGQDMLAKGYWAHFAPDGTSPWSFFSKFGYGFKYAGENLARDFTNPDNVVKAWMNSASHRKNILNANYKEIGIGVVEGKMNGVDTTIVVQFFGAKSKTVVNAPIPEVRAEGVSTESAESVQEVKPIISPFTVTKNISMAIVGLIILVLSVDLLIIRTEKISRISGRTLAHIAYLGMVMAVLLILKAGQII